MSGVLITGGTGYLGHGLVRFMLKAAYGRIRVFSRSEVSQARMQEALGNDERLGYFVGDVRDLDRLERAMARCSLVIHAAALKRIEVGHYNPDEMVKTNVLGAMNVIEAARRARVRRVVFVSTDKAFEPVSPYGLSKAMAEQLFLAANRQSLGPRFVVCRYGNVAGSTGSVIPVWREQLRRGEQVKVTDPNCTRFWMRLDQAVRLVVQAIDTDEEFIVPELPAYRLMDLQHAMGIASVQILGLRPWEKKHEAMGPCGTSETAPRLTIEDLRAELELVPA